MVLKIAINGFGRIGRSVTRLVSQRDDIEIVAINDLSDIQTMAYLLENDSVHGSFNHEVEVIDENYMGIDGHKIRILSEPEPKNVRFADYGADMLIECSGLFLTQKEAQIHIDRGVKKVLFSAPSKDTLTSTFVMGVNENLYAGESIVSNASCTTNCLAPIAKTLDDAFGIEKGLMTTIHSYTNDQNILDVNHARERRRSRAAAVNMIPTTTGAAKAIGRVLPQLEGKLHGQSVRVPVPDVSMLDLTINTKKETTLEEVNALLNKMAQNSLKGILLIDKKMRVSQDFVNCTHSSVVAEDLTQVMGGNMLKVMAWYDNEWGYSNRLIDMALYINKKG